MFNDFFQRVDLQNQALDIYWLKKTTIAQNIANVETPNYKRKDIDFEALLNNRSKEFDLKITNRAHFRRLKPMTFSKSPLTSMRIDGNNVTVENEMAEDAKVTILYNAVISRLNSQFMRMNQAVRGGR